MGTEKKNIMKMWPAGVLAVFILVLFSLSGCGSSAQPEDEAHNREFLQRKDVPVYGFNVLNTYNHDRSAFTEGLVLDGDLIYEGTGHYGESRLTKSELATGDVLLRHDLESTYFGEGVTVLGDEVFQLTYTSNLGFVYDKDSFELDRTFQYPTQGWGLTHDGSSLIISDGSSTLHFLDPQTMQETGYLSVEDNEGPVYNLNELEFIDGEIYANVWKTSLIAIISPDSGEVTGYIDLSGLNPDPSRLKGELVLNGIAYDPQTGRLLVTGKCWPYIYEIELIPAS